MKCDLVLKKNAKLSRSRPYRLSDEMRLEVDRQLDELLAARIISECDGSPICSPITCVKKRDGS